MKLSMKLSEAMRLGAMLKPQGFGAMINVWGGTCALGAVADAVGQELVWPPAWCPILDVLWLRTRYPILDMFAIDPVIPGAYSGRLSLADVIVRLNDDHRWTRERIADWIEANFESTPSAAPEQESAESKEKEAVLV